MNNQNKDKPKGMLLDIMLCDRFVCQLRYDKRGWPKMVDGRIIEVHEMADIQRFVEQQRPSLKGKPYQISFSIQKVKPKNN